MRQIIFVVCLLLASALPEIKGDDDDDVEIVSLPVLETATPHYIRTHQSAQLVASFESDVMNADTEVEIAVRGAGFWDTIITCDNISPTSIQCNLPRFSLNGEVDLRARFNGSQSFTSPFLPLGHSFTVWQLKLTSLSPSVMPRTPSPVNVTLHGTGLFKHTSRDNLRVQLIGTNTQLIDNSHVFIDGLQTHITLPGSLERGRYSISVSVDEGETYVTCDQCAITVFEPMFDESRLNIEPSCGPISGSSHITLHGIYGILVKASGGLKIQLRTQQYTANNTVRVFEKIVPLMTSDTLSPYVVLSDKPTFSFVTPVLPVSGIYSIHIGYDNVFSPVPLTFMAYKANITHMIPLASLVTRPASHVTFCSTRLPDTGLFHARFTQPLTSNSGITSRDITTVKCETEIQVSESGECIACEIPEFGSIAGRGTVVHIEFSLNGQDYDTHLPQSEFVYYEPEIRDMAPTRGQIKGQIVTITGHGFIDSPGLAVVATSHSTSASRTVPARFIGEGIIQFTMPDMIEPTNEPTETVSVALIPTGDPEVMIPLPDFTYDAVEPSLSSIVVDSGNRLSPTISITNSIITIRITSQSPLQLARIQQLHIGNKTITSLNNSNMTSVMGSDDCVWVTKYQVMNGDEGEVMFVIEVVNPQGNVDVVDSLSSLVDKRVVVDTQAPHVTQTASSSGDPRQPTQSHGGSTITFLITSSQPLTSLLINSFTIGQVSINVNDVVVQSIGGYPSASWKIQYVVPKIHPNGLVEFDLALKGIKGNVLKSVTAEELEIVMNVTD